MGTKKDDFGALKCSKQCVFQAMARGGTPKTHPGSNCANKIIQWNQPRKWFRLFVLHFPLTYRLKIQTTGSSYDPSKVCDVQDRLSWILKKFLSFFLKKWKNILHFFGKNERFEPSFLKDSFHFFEKIKVWKKSWNQINRSCTSQT